MNTERASAQTLRCQPSGARGVVTPGLSHRLAPPRRLPYALPVAAHHTRGDSPMDFGTFLLLQTPSADPSDVVYRRGVEITQAAEALGFRNMWLAEHHFSTYGLLSRPLTYALHLADKTRT